MTVSNEAVEAAEEAIRELWDSKTPVTPHDEARAALEAAAPFIHAQALEDAANAMWDASPATIQGPDTGQSWLRARAAALRGQG